MHVAVLYGNIVPPQSLVAGAAAAPPYVYLLYALQAVSALQAVFEDFYCILVSSIYCDIV